MGCCRYFTGSSDASYASVPVYLILNATAALHNLSDDHFILEKVKKEINKNTNQVKIYAVTKCLTVKVSVLYMW